MGLFLARLVPGAMLVFKLAMLVHALQRRVDGIWILVILLAPFGEVLYFVLEFLPSQPRRQPGSRPPRRTPQDIPPPEPLSPSPSARYDARIVRQLVEHGQSGEAVDLLQARLADTPDDRDATLLLGRALASMGDHEGAIEQLELLGPKVRGARRDVVRKHLVDALIAADRQADAADQLRALAKESPTPLNRLRLAQHLADHGPHEEARAVLDTMLASAEHAEKQGFAHPHTVVSEARALRQQLG